MDHVHVHLYWHRSLLAVIKVFLSMTGFYFTLKRYMYVILLNFILQL